MCAIHLTPVRCGGTLLRSANHAGKSGTIAIEKIDFVGAFAGSTALEQCRAQGRWPLSYDQFWEVLKQRQGRESGTRAMIEVLLLGRAHDPARVQQAGVEALQLGCSDVGACAIYWAPRAGSGHPPLDQWNSAR